MKPCSESKKGQLEVIGGQVLDGDSQDGQSWKLVISGSRRKLFSTLRYELSELFWCCYRLRKEHVRGGFVTSWA